MDCGIAGDLWVLLFTGIEEEGRLGQSMDTVEKWLAQTLAHVSVRSDAVGVVAPRREAAAKPCAVPDLRQRLPRVIQRREARGSCQGSTRFLPEQAWMLGHCPDSEHSTPSSELTQQGASGDCTQWKRTQNQDGGSQHWAQTSLPSTQLCCGKDTSVLSWLPGEKMVQLHLGIKSRDGSVITAVPEPALLL